MAQLTIEEKNYFRTENKINYLDGLLKGFTDFNTLIEERIAQMDRLESELWKKGQSKRKAYYVEKIKNLSSHLVSEIVRFHQYPRPSDCEGTEKAQRKNALDRITMMQIDFAIILRHSTDIASELGYMALAPKLLIKLK